jgi:aspartyl-tRNA(Asn)/glutamyl-tRNA(Gln) amidotransferase subunit A
VSTFIPAPHAMPVHQLSSSLTEGRVTPTRLVESLLARIERYDRKLHAFVAVYADQARQAAAVADAAIRTGNAVGPLHGIPVAVKDIVEIKGRITTGGSKVWAEQEGG